MAKLPQKVFVTVDGEDDLVDLVAHADKTELEEGDFVGVYLLERRGVVDANGRIVQKKKEEDKKKKKKEEEDE